ncbi:spore germination protein KC [Lysinibacillus composti]|uniref:Ger(X)C family spore germination protein n=1 Tax=Lysinibacillus composti TaxID=720633 RepID=A0A3N9UJR1_9BACI|nr:Ger(x)C family spore germination protein [Lysinibacillus composti]MBM7609653.1 spore germination protein KC [Lysinibacillus composti]RQW75638.1 Ger(x)C family spore germination protein [Lysinibacillus composti]
MLKKRNKIKQFFLLIILILTALSGCGEFKDIDKDVFVSMIGIDLSDDPEKPYKVTLKLYVPTSSFKQSPKPEYTYLTKNGKTLTEAIRILETHSDKEIDFGHSKLIVIGEELLNANKSKEIMDFLLRRPDIQMISWLAIGRPSAEEIIKMVPQSETAAYPALFNYFDHNGTDSPYIVTTYLFDFRRKMLETGIDPILPLIEINKEEEHFEVNKSYVLAHDKKPHELSSLDTLIFNMMTRNLDVADLVINEDNQHFIAKIDNINSKYKVKVDAQHQVKLNIDIELFGYISESKDTISNQQLPQYSKMVEAETREKFSDFFIKMLNVGYDPIGFGLAYKSKTLHNKRMSPNEWNEAYKNSKVNIKVMAGIKSTGSIQ